MTLFQLVQTLYWLALATWFGGSLFVALSAPVIFRTVRESNPILPNVLSVNLEGQHGSLLAGDIVAGLLRMLGYVQIGCAAVLLLMLLSQWRVMDLSYRNIGQGIIRATLFVAAVVMMSYDRWIVWPRALRYREEFIEHADVPEVANAAKEQFDRYHRESVRVLFIIVALLSLMIVFSTGITPSYL